MPTQHPNPDETDPKATTHPDDPQPLHDAELTPAEREQLSDPERQERYRKEALLQLRRLQCPGCGESELF